ncbi:MAG: hypothetical protein H0V35_15135 [Nitrospira sp.]|nr:hypothetical protein [Nitrospira sp.]
MRANGTPVPWLDLLLGVVDNDRQKYEFETGRIEFSDEIESFRYGTDYAVNEDRLIPGTSRLSLLKLRQVRSGSELLTEVDLERLERI